MIGVRHATPGRIARIVMLMILGLIATVQGVDFRAQAAVTNAEWVINGDREGRARCIFPATMAESGYSTDSYVSFGRSARLRVPLATDAYVDSWMSQPTTVPLFSTAETLMPQGQAYPLGQPLDGNHRPYAQIRDQQGVLHTFWYSQRNEASHRLARRFVSTLSPTPSSSSCQQLIQNPDFRHGYDGWVQNLYLTARYQDEAGQAHEGAWFGGAEFIDQYLYQDVAIPAGGTTVRLSLLWALDPGMDMEPSDALTITLRQTDDTILETLLVIDADSFPRRWQTASFDLSPYIGQNVRVHARATTSATTTSWYLDQIQLLYCELGYRTYLPWVLKSSFSQGIQ